MLEVITAAAVVSLPIDLLYLYFAGGWNEPSDFVLGAELAVLFLLPMFGIWKLYDFVKANGNKVECYQAEGESDRSDRKS